MSQAEKYSWASLVTTGLIFWFFQMRMLDGWQVVDRSGPALLGTYLTVVVMFIIAEAIIGVTIALTSGKHDIEKDERDKAIEARANQFAFYFLIVAINVIIVHLLAGNISDEWQLQIIDLTSPASVFFALFTILVIAHLIEQIATLVSYAK